MGVKVVENVRAQNIQVLDGRATRRGDGQGSIRSEYVVLTGGMWTRELGLSCGVTIPLYPVEHHYVVTEPLPGAFDELPVGRDPDLCIYFSGEGDAVMLGAFQNFSKAWNIEKIPPAFSFQLLEPDWGQIFRTFCATSKAPHTRLAQREICKVCERAGKFHARQ